MGGHNDVPLGFCSRRKDTVITAAAPAEQGEDSQSSSTPRVVRYIDGWNFVMAARKSRINWEKSVSVRS